MTRLWLKVFLWAFCALALVSVPACQADEITSMNVAMTAQRDSTLDVVERINVNFSEPRHGIFRTLPVKYSRFGASYTVDFHLNSVKDENDQSLAFSQSSRGNDINIKIGSANKVFAGTHTYVINYKLRRAVNFFDKEPEIYWNVTGDQWPYPIRLVKFSLDLPAGFNASAVKTKAFLGAPNSQSSEGVAFEQAGQKLYFQANDIAPGQGLTVAVRLPSGAMVAPPLSTEIGWFLIDWYPLFLLPGLTFFGLYATWRYLGTDEEPISAIACDWQPPKELTPAEMGVIIDERVDSRDVLSIVVDLAVRGYFKIVEVDKPGFWGANKDYQFERNADADMSSKDLKPFEIEMLQSLFKWQDESDYDFVTRLSDLSAVGAVRFSHFSQLLYASMTENGWFRASPEDVRRQYMQIGTTIVMLAAFSLLFASNLIGVPAILGAIFSAILFFFFSGAMPARTLSGVKLRRQSLAFACFVEKVDKVSIRALADKDPTIFARLLPYAMVINAADHWAEAFEGLAVDRVALPTWYQSSESSSDFRPGYFVRCMSTGLGAISTGLQAVAPSSSAGSGASGTLGGGGGGGGFGGGGGDSW